MDSLSEILGVPDSLLLDLDAVMARATGRSGVLEIFAEENSRKISRALEELGSSRVLLTELRTKLHDTVFEHERQFLKYLFEVSGNTEFEKAATLARDIAQVGQGFFLKREFAEAILRARPPTHLLEHFGYKSVDELLSRHDVLESMSALRFMESDEWMHETFDAAYSAFKADDFEERDIQIEVLGDEWHEVALKFVAKKHHNVSHLKEFGVIFLNPVSEDVPGKFLRDFALLLHYFHEIDFYSKLFRRYSAEDDFASKFKALLRGDLPEATKVAPGEWLIIQRYLAKVDPKDARLFLPRVNPESLHWGRGERDLVQFSLREAGIDLEFWKDLDSAGTILDGELVSFDLEDNAMSAVSSMEGLKDFFTYHQREAMWTKLFEAYVGGEAQMEALLMDHFSEGIIRFGK